MDTDFASLERELRGDSYTEVPESNAVPDEYADLAEEYGSPVNGRDGHDGGAPNSRR